ncbi:MAG TPA: HEAT repeat domain-containing protein [Ignavibacteriaceae bacterium]|nr:HEAT repeat domain-containing protein [Ignavibacteriaceae bacterium]
MKRISLTIVVLAAIVLSVKPLSAQKDVDSKNTAAVANLVNGINSENKGLQRSSIYLAGRDRVTGSVDALIEKLNNEEDPSTRLLIAVSLYEIRDPLGLDAIKELSVKDKSEKVRSISSLMYSEYAKSTDVKFVTVNNNSSGK